MAKGYTRKPRKKAVNPIERDTKFRSDQLAIAQLKEDNKRQIKYGPRGKMVPKAGTNGSFV
jgi:hypothetical protein